MKQWYVVEVTASGQQTHGPLDLTGVRTLLEQGRLTSQSKACEVGALGWMTLADIDELRVLIEPHAVAPRIVPAFPVYSIGNALEVGFVAFKSNYALLLLVTLIFMAVQGVLQLVSLPLTLLSERLESGADSFESNPAFLLMVLLFVLLLAFVGLLISIPVAAGIQWTGVRAVRNKLQISDVFEPFRRFFAVVGVSAIVGLGVLAALLPVVIVFAISLPRFDSDELRYVNGAGELVPAFFALFLSVVVILYLSTRLYFASVLVMDDEVTDENGMRLGVWAALRRSWQMTRGRVLSLFVYGMLAVFIVMATLFLFCVGILFVGVPLAMTFYGSAYETLRRSP